MSDLLERAITLLRDASLVEASLLLLAENVVVFLLAIATGAVIVRMFPERRVAHLPERTEAIEVALTISTIVLNTVITIVGWWLWREGIVKFRTDTGVRAWLIDPLLLLVIMDIAMYALHRVAHVGSLYPLLHRTHHRFDRPHPLTLFVLNPFEAVAFGSLWLAVIIVMDFSWIGMAIYLGLNVLFGVVGHLGVEPLPDRFKHLPILRWLSTSTFHARHHQDRKHNFGFYTLVWDKLFGTLSPHYESAFGLLPSPDYEQNVPRRNSSEARKKNPIR
jgi:Delta7-sterol 5-desaturase